MNNPLIFIYKPLSNLSSLFNTIDNSENLYSYVIFIFQGFIINIEFLFYFSKRKIRIKINLDQTSTNK